MKRLILCILLNLNIALEISCTNDTEHDSLTGENKEDYYYNNLSPYDDKFFIDLLHFEFKNGDFFQESDLDSSNFGQFLLDKICQIQREDWFLNTLSHDHNDCEFDFSTAIFPFINDKKFCYRDVLSTAMIQQQRRTNKKDYHNYTLNRNLVQIVQKESHTKSTVSLPDHSQENSTQQTQSVDDVALKENDLDNKEYDDSYKYITIKGSRYYMDLYDITRNEDGTLDFGDKHKLEKQYYLDFFDIYSLEKKISELCTVCANAFFKNKKMRNRYEGCRTSCFRAIFSKINILIEEEQRQPCFNKCIEIIKAKICPNNYKTFLYNIMTTRDSCGYIKNLCNAICDNYKTPAICARGIIFGDIVCRILLIKQCQNINLNAFFKNIKDINIMQYDFVYWVLYYYFFEVSVGNKVYKEFKRSFVKIMDWIMLQDECLKHQLYNEIRECFSFVNTYIDFPYYRQKQDQVMDILLQYNINMDLITPQICPITNPLKRKSISQNTSGKRVAM